MTDLEIRSLSVKDLDQHLEALSRILHACVHGGAAVSFVLPFPMGEATAFWRDQVRPSLADGGRIVLTAFLEGAPVATTQVLLAMPPNQAHRAEIAKLLTDPAHRRLGAARRLMQAAEAAARAAGKTVMTLDTRTGDAAETLYAGLGYARAGVIPDFARDPDSDCLHGTTYMYKRLA